MERRVRREKDPHTIITHHLSYLFGCGAQLKHDKRIHQEARDRYGESSPHVQSLERQAEFSEGQLNVASQEVREIIIKLLPKRLFVSGVIAEVTDPESPKVIEVEAAALNLTDVQMMPPKTGEVIPAPLLVLSHDNRRYKAFYTQIRWEPAQDTAFDATS